MDGGFYPHQGSRRGAWKVADALARGGNQGVKERGREA